MSISHLNWVPRSVSAILRGHSEERTTEMLGNNVDSLPDGGVD